MSRMKISSEGVGWGGIIEAIAKPQVTINHQQINLSSFQGRGKTEKVLWRHKEWKMEDLTIKRSLFGEGNLSPFILYFAFSLIDRSIPHPQKL